MNYFDGIETYIFSQKNKLKPGPFSLLNNDKKVQNFFGSIESKFNLQCMLAVYYPPGGGLDWHTNEEANMHNAICTYSTSSKSFIELKDQKIYDKENEWTIKYTYWTEDNPIPHRVVSVGERITFTFSSPNKKLVKDFINNII
jgi:hypothetical protein